jgi:undecaprenyl pyrophosphate synthase
MKISETDILIIPGYTGSGPEHWQTRWEQKIATARRVEQQDWTKPDFMLWQAAYAELVFVDTLWPDFDRGALEAAIADFRRRDRRYGGVARVE